MSKLTHIHPLWPSYSAAAFVTAAARRPRAKAAGGR